MIINDLPVVVLSTQYKEDIPIYVGVFKMKRVICTDRTIRTNDVLHLVVEDDNIYYASKYDDKYSIANDDLLVTAVLLSV